MRNIWNLIKRVALCILVGQVAVGQSLRANEDTGLVGAKLEVVEKSHDLFTFFNLQRTGSEALPEHRTLVTFKPTAETFRPLVTLAVTTDAQGVIESLRLDVARSFIDDPQQGIFAADLVGSFLRSAGGNESEDDLAALSKEIHARSLMNPGRTVLTAQPAPALATTPSAAYRVYAGKGPAQTLFNRGHSLQAVLDNKDDSDHRQLEITLSRR